MFFYYTPYNNFRGELKMDKDYFGFENSPGMYAKKEAIQRDDILNMRIDLNIIDDSGEFLKAIGYKGTIPSVYDMRCGVRPLTKLMQTARKRKAAEKVQSSMDLGSQDIGG